MVIQCSTSQDVCFSIMSYHLIFIRYLNFLLFFTSVLIYINPVYILRMSQILTINEMIFERFLQFVLELLKVICVFILCDESCSVFPSESRNIDRLKIIFFYIQLRILLKLQLELAGIYPQIFILSEELINFCADIIHTLDDNLVELL